MLAQGLIPTNNAAAQLHCVSVSRKGKHYASAVMQRSILNMNNPLQRIRNFITGRYTVDGLNEQDGYAYPDGDNQRQLFTALDIGTAYAKALIIEVQDDIAVVLGAGRHAQSYKHMSD